MGSSTRRLGDIPSNTRLKSADRGRLFDYDAVIERKQRLLDAETAADARVDELLAAARALPECVSEHDPLPISSVSPRSRAVCLG